MSYPYCGDYKCSLGIQKSNLNPEIPKSKKYYLAPSKIHGTGVMASQSLESNEPIEIGIKIYLKLFPVVTSNFGSYLNHSWTPNTYLAHNGQDYWLHASHPISTNEELTLDYRETPWYILGPDPNW